MNNKDLISVIIPIYNVDKYLSRCIDSVINQTYKNLEIILVDDGSTDNSGKICDEYALKDTRIKVIHKQNGGVSSARNVGLDIAKGEYIGFIDSDDYIESDMYEFLYDLLIKNNTEISCCNKFDFNSITNKYLPDKCFPKEGILSLNEVLQDIGGGFHIVTKIFNKNLINNIRFNEKFAIGEDLLFCFKVLKNSKKTIFKNIAKYYYYNNQNSVIRKKVFKRKFLCVITIHNHIINYAKKNNLLFAYKKFTKYKINWIISFLIRMIEDNSINENKYSLNFLLKCAKKNMMYIFFCNISILRKCFILIACINFNLASKIYRLILKLKRKK